MMKTLTEANMCKPSRMSHCQLLVNGTDENVRGLPIYVVQYGSQYLSCHANNEDEAKEIVLPHFKFFGSKKKKIETSTFIVKKIHA